ncbi:MAG: DUF3576 domain-containing protein [Sphingomonadales bacterium]|nr:DUF3576 domain-containing protein [Sphingomonadales bacterium]
MSFAKIGIKTLTAFVLGTSLTACSYLDTSTTPEQNYLPTIQEDMSSAIGVNGYLWLAALDTVSLFPISQVDSNGGVILTDWFIDPDASTERLKMSIYITDKTLRADALHVSIIRQELIDGMWINATVRAGTSLQVEDAILAKARELKINTLENE